MPAEWFFETDKNSFVADRMIDAQRQSFKGKIYFRDFYGAKGDLTISVKLDVTEFDRLLLPTVIRPLERFSIIQGHSRTS